MRIHKTTLAVTAILIATLTLNAQVPPRPEQLTFPELTFDVPDASAMRFELDNGIPVFAKPDTQLPLVNVSVLFRGGRYLTPAGKEGLSAVASAVWRSGGAGDRTAQELDEELDFLAASISTSIGDVTGSLGLNAMTKDFDAVMTILMDVITAPRFQDDRFAKAKNDLLQSMKRRNDDGADIERREWSRLVYGDGYWMNQLSTQASVSSISAEDCRTFVTSLVRAGNVIVAVSGDFTTDGIKATLNRTIGQLPELEREVPPIPQPQRAAAPGVYVVHKEDVNQGRVRLGHIGVKLGHPDEFALRVGNDILGGGGFTSRITRRVRSEEGLAYSAGSSLSFPVTIPGVFVARFQTKSSTCAYASQLTLGLIDEILAENVSEQEMTIAKNSFVETFPRRFESAAQTVRIFASDELLGRPAGYWLNYRDQIAAVEGDAVREAAIRTLKPENFIILVVGNMDEIMEGHPDHEARLTDFGEVTTLPLRDPMTLVPIP